MGVGEPGVTASGVVLGRGSGLNGRAGCDLPGLTTKTPRKEKNAA